MFYYLEFFKGYMYMLQKFYNYILHAKEIDIKISSGNNLKLKVNPKPMLMKKGRSLKIKNSNKLCDVELCIFITWTMRAIRTAKFYIANG